MMHTGVAKSRRVRGRRPSYVVTPESSYMPKNLGDWIWVDCNMHYFEDYDCGLATDTPIYGGAASLIAGNIK